MTSWQYSCLEALITSPYHFDIFKLKQRNRKVLDQYLSRLFPYKVFKYYNGKNIKKRLNVGIEIEHCGSFTNDKIKSEILNQGIVSFDSGYDGNYRNGKYSEEKVSRLRENRIRLNGILGIKGLYTMLKFMKENCKLAQNSSVHIHIDCSFDKTYTYLKNIIDIRDTWSGFDLSKLIKELNEYTIYLPDFDNNEIKFNSEFDTIEYRMCKPTFDYSQIMAEVLFFIHITQIAKYQVEPNIELLKAIIKIKNELVK